MSEKLTRTQIKNLERLGGVNPADESFSRRQFLTQVGGYGAAAGAAVGGGLLLRDPWGMEGVKPPPARSLKPFNVDLPASTPSLVVVRSAPVGGRRRRRNPRGRDPTTRPSGWSRRRSTPWAASTKFIAKGDVVVVKPNVAFDKNPDLAATTQPDTVAAVVKLCLGAGARKVIVADNPINNPESCFFKTKVGDAARPSRGRADAARRTATSSSSTSAARRSPTPGGCSTGRSARPPRSSASRPVKDHNLCKATVTMKNWYGLLGNPRNQFHQDIHGIISDFALMMKPTLVVADGRKLLMRNGPTGGSLNDVKKGDAIVVGTDHVGRRQLVRHPPAGEVAARDRLPRQGHPAAASASDWRPQWTRGDHDMSAGGGRSRSSPYWLVELCRKHECWPYDESGSHDGRAIDLVIHDHAPPVQSDHCRLRRGLDVRAGRATRGDMRRRSHVRRQATASSSPRESIRNARTPTATAVFHWLFPESLKRLTSKHALTGIPSSD